MDAVHGDMIDRGVRRLGKRRSPGEMSVVANAAPINRAQDDRLAGPKQHDPQRPERIIDAAHRFDPAAAKGMIERGGHVGGKSGNVVLHGDCAVPE